MIPSSDGDDVALTRQGPVKVHKPKPEPGTAIPRRLGFGGEHEIEDGAFEHAH